MSEIPPVDWNWKEGGQLGICFDESLGERFLLHAAVLRKHLARQQVRSRATDLLRRHAGPKDVMSE